jgi:hypothetical protein
MTEGHVTGVLIALEHNIIDSLENKLSVHLGRIGTFSIGISTEGCTTKQKFNAKMVTKKGSCSARG